MVLIYQYLNIIKETGVKKEIFDELHRIGDLEFRFIEKSQPANYTSTLAGQMQVKPTDTIFVTRNHRFLTSCQILTLFSIVMTLFMTIIFFDTFPNIETIFDTYRFMRLNTYYPDLIFLPNMTNHSFENV